MHKELDVFFRNQPDFKKVEEGVYIFEQNGKEIGFQLAIYFSLETNNRESFPIYVVSLDHPHCWAMPVWIKELEIKANELYFQVNRIKCLLFRQSRTINNLLFYFLYFEKEGSRFYSHFDCDTETQEFSFHVDFFPYFDKFRLLLSKHGYEIVSTSTRADGFATCRYTHDFEMDKTFWMDNTKNKTLA